MPNRNMATHTAIRAVRQCAVIDEIVHQSLMALNAVDLQDVGVLLLDANRFGKILQGEGLGVKEAVLRLGDVFADEIVRQMAVDALGVRVMTGFLPTVVLVTHDVAVDAGFRITAEVRGAFRVPKGIDSKPEHRPDDGTQKQRPQGDRKSVV